MCMASMGTITKTAVVGGRASLLRRSKRSLYLYLYLYLYLLLATG